MYSVAYSLFFDRLAASVNMIHVILSAGVVCSKFGKDILILTVRFCQKMTFIVSMILSESNQADRLICWCTGMWDCNMPIALGSNTAFSALS
jgi:hypothetical protein